LGTEDIREKAFLTHGDIVSLNFVRVSGDHYFRRHHRAGLRSHVMEVLRREDVEREERGAMMDGLLSFPRAKPKKVLRIFRTRFKNLAEAMEEPRRIKIIENFLSPRHLARSDEFIVDYVRGGNREILLCGLQEFVEGEILDPWQTLDDAHLLSLYRRLEAGGWKKDPDSRIQRIRDRAAHFILKTKALIRNSGYVPDLAGVGNLILSRDLEIKLVDINNISRIPPPGTIPLDDRGYPVCDKSIEALALLEKKLLGNLSVEDDPIYRTFLDATRKKEVSSIVRTFHSTPGSTGL